jgi:hypothetical protein
MHKIGEEQMNAQEYERKETARLDEMYDAMFDDTDCEYDIAKAKYEEQFANAFEKLIGTIQEKK